VVIASARREQVLSTIMRELAPYVGENMARAATRMYCEKLGFVAAEIAAPDVERLLEALAPGLHVFIGRKKTEDALHLIRRALADESRALADESRALADERGAG
jgi:hypothetical protein